MPRTQSRPGDLTGRTRETQAAKHVEELERRSDEIGLINAAQQAQVENEYIDYTEPLGTSKPLDEIEVLEVEEDRSWAMVHMLDELENTTFGPGNMRSFKAGHKYKLDVAWANHLSEKGYAQIL